MVKKLFPNVPTRSLREEHDHLEVFFAHDHHPDYIEEFLKNV